MSGGWLATGLVWALMGGGATTAPLTFDPTSYASPVFGGGKAQLQRALSEPGVTRRVRRLGFTASDVDRNCHTQAISIVHDQVAMSCVDRRNGVGWLQIFDRDPRSPEPTRRGRAVRLDDGNWPHPAVGQAIWGRGPRAGEQLMPIGNESLDIFGARKDSRLEVRDGNGALVCAIHNERPGGLSATALVSTGAAIFAIAVSYSELLIWRIDGVTDHGAACDARLVFAAKGADVGGSGWKRYQGIAALLDHTGDVFLLGGRRHSVDAWKLSGLGNDQMRVESVGSMDWRPAAMPKRGVFHEGLAVEPHAGGLRIWAAPRDFWRGTCLPAGADARCTSAIYYVDKPFDKPMERPALSWR